jgi:hypothetical protein
MAKVMNIVKTRVISWYNEKTKIITYGFDIKINGNHWAHVKDEKGPLFYKTRKDALRAAKELRLSMSNNNKLPL